MPEAPSGRLRRSPHLVVYWRDDQSIIYNFATGDSVAGHPLTLAALDFFSTWRRREEYVRSRPGDNRQQLGRLVTALVRHRMMEVEGRPDPRERAMRAWEAWNPAAGFFHRATRDVRFASLADVESRRRVAPPRQAARPGRAGLRLPPPRRDGEFADVLQQRRTWRAFAARPVPLADLATLLWFTAGVQRWAPLHGGGRAPLKVSPSGGALHPTEVYVLARRIDGLPRGLYHYRHADHRLDLLRRRTSARPAPAFLPQQPWYDQAAAVVFFTTVFERSLARYDYARAYRANLIEAGHCCQTFCLTATWLGLAPFCSMALADSVIERALAIDGLREAVVYAAGVGVRPAGTSWEPAPLDPSIPWLDPPPGRRRR